MRFKTDTKQKFSVLHVECAALTANLAAELCTKLRELGAAPPHNVILNLAGTPQLEKEAAEVLATLRAEFYENQRSFVVCGLPAAAQEAVAEWELEEALNLTPTESEAWDIVQMDEIEREFLAGDE